MKAGKRLMALILFAVLVSSLSGLALAYQTDAGLTVFPVKYGFSVDNDKGTSIWAYEIEDEVYFKLRDIAMALNYTSKQFSVAWDSENKTVELAKDESYDPMGGELSDPGPAAVASVHYTDYSIRNINGWGNILAILVNDTHYVKLSDLMAVLKAESSYDKENHMVRINTLPKTPAIEECREPFDNIAVFGQGNSFYLKQDGTVTLVYKSKGLESTAPLRLLPADSDDLFGQTVDQAGLYISEPKTAIAYGGQNGSPLHVLTSEDMGETWHTSKVIARNVGVSKLYVGFSTANDGWLVVSNFHGMGNEHHYLYVTADGGDTWTQIGNPNDLYARVATGAGFATPTIGFISFRVDDGPGPTIYRTMDKGYTWEKLEVSVPDGYDNNIPLSPVFFGAEGVYPIEHRTNDGDTATYYLTSTDYGETWTVDE